MMAEKTFRTEEAVRAQEQILNLFCGQETELYRGCILKRSGDRLIVCPLYCKSDAYTPERIQMCEEIGRRRNLNCEFHIIERTNYYFASLLTDNGYRLQDCCLIGELSLREGDASPILLSRSKPRRILAKPDGSNPKRHRTGAEGRRAGRNDLRLRTSADSQAETVLSETGAFIGLKRQNLLFLPQGALPRGVTLDGILRFSLKNEIARIFVRITGGTELPEHYREMGFRKNHLYRRYQKQPGQEAQHPEQAQV